MQRLAPVAASQYGSLETMERSAPGIGQLRLIVVDPHTLARWALTQVADNGSDLRMVGEAAGADEALALAFAVKPDVAAISCAASDSEGWALAARLRKLYPDMGIVILSGDASDRMLFQALNTGASAFVAKSAPIADVLAAVRHAGVAPSSFAAAGLAEAMRRKNEATDRLALSPREHEILVLLHDGMSVPAIAAQLFVSLSTAKTYVARLYDKLEAHNRAQALMTAVRLGLLVEQFERVGA